MFQNIISSHKKYSRRNKCEKKKNEPVSGTPKDVVKNTLFRRIFLISFCVICNMRLLSSFPWNLWLCHTQWTWFFIFSCIGSLLKNALRSFLWKLENSTCCIIPEIHGMAYNTLQERCWYLLAFSFLHSYDCNAIVGRMNSAFLEKGN